LGLILFETNDGVRAKACGTNIGRIQIGVISEDNVISRYGLAVRELHTNTQASGIGGLLGYRIVILGQVCGTLVFVRNIIVGQNFAFNSVHHNLAQAVSGHKTNLGHTCNVSVISSFREEGAEFFRELFISHNEWGIDCGCSGQILTEGFGFENDRFLDGFFLNGLFLDRFLNGFFHRFLNGLFNRLFDGGFWRHIFATSSKHATEHHCDEQK